MLGIAKLGHLSAAWNTGERDWFPSLDATSNFQAIWPGVIPSMQPNSNYKAQTTRHWSISSHINLTGYTALAGYNTRRYAAISYFKIPDANLLSGTNFMVYGAQLRDANGSDFYHNIQASNNNGYLQIAGAYSNYFGIGGEWDAVQIPLSTYENRWLAFVMAGAESEANFFANFDNNNSGNRHHRYAVYDMSFPGGSLIGYQDYVDDSNQYVDISALPTTLETSPANGSNPMAEWFIFGGNGDLFKQSGFWAAYGTAFDPGDTTLAATYLGRAGSAIDTIAGAEAWYNGIYTGSYQTNNVSAYVEVSSTHRHTTTAIDGIANPAGLGIKMYDLWAGDPASDGWSTIDSPDGGGTI